jgi:hypothetical protein
MRNNLLSDRSRDFIIYDKRKPIFVEPVGRAIPSEFPTNKDNVGKGVKTIARKVELRESNVSGN